MIRRHWLVSTLVLCAGCADPSAPTSFGVNVTVDAHAVSAAVRDTFASVRLTVTGDQAPFSTAANIVKPLQSGEARFRYIPAVHSGSLQLHVDVALADGAIVSSGDSAAITLTEGKAVSASIVLGAAAGVADMRVDTDGSPPGDMAAADLATAPQGSACTANEQCGTGVCSDGYCCDKACDGVCSACNLPGSLGTCTTVSADAAPPTGHGSCTATPMSACGDNGMCDGKGACQLWPLNTVCAASTCDNTQNTFTSSRVCDGKGTCQAATTLSCAPFDCKDATQCNATCTSNSDCSSGNVCNNGSCGLKTAGQTCTAGTECASTFCVDGVCCGSACGGKCQTCNQAGALGVCTPVPLGQDPRAMCPAGAGDDKNCTPGGCDGTANNACTIEPANTACGGSCSGSVPIDGKCDVIGKCSQNIQSNACPNCQACTAGATSASCAPVPNTTQCAAGFCAGNNAYAAAFCNNGTCPAQTAFTSCGQYTCFGAGVCHTDCGTCGGLCVEEKDCTAPINSNCVSGSCAGTCVCTGSGFCLGHETCQ